MLIPADKLSVDYIYDPFLLRTSVVLTFERLCVKILHDVRSIACGSKVVDFQGLSMATFKLEIQVELEPWKACTTFE